MGHGKVRWVRMQVDDGHFRVVCTSHVTVWVVVLLEHMVVLDATIFVRWFIRLYNIIV